MNVKRRVELYLINFFVQLLQMIAFDESFEPRLNDGLFPAGRLSLKKSFTVSKPKGSGAPEGIGSGSAAVEESSRRASIGTLPIFVTSQSQMIEIKFSAELKDFIAQCLQRNSLKRYGVISFFCLELPNRCYSSVASKPVYWRI